MAEEKSKFKLGLYAIVMVLVFFSLIRVFVDGSGKFFMLELLGFLFLLILTLISFIGYKEFWGERVLFFVFLMYLINVILVWKYNGNLSFFSLFLGLLGFVLAGSGLSAGPSKDKKSRTRPPFKPKPKPAAILDEPHSEIFDLPEEEFTDNEAEKEKESLAEKKSDKSARFNPGKYVASNMSNTYHEPRCEWAKKISANRRVWFKDKQEAQKKGYKKHSCVN